MLQFKFGADWLFRLSTVRLLSIWSSIFSIRKSYKNWFIFELTLSVTLAGLMKRIALLLLKVTKTQGLLCWSVVFSFVYKVLIFSIRKSYKTWFIWIHFPRHIYSAYIVNCSIASSNGDWSICSCLIYYRHVETFFLWSLGNTAWTNWKLQFGIPNFIRDNYYKKRKIFTMIAHIQGWISVRWPLTPLKSNMRKGGNLDPKFLPNDVSESVAN